MKEISRKLISLMLVLLIAITAFPITVLASEEDLNTSATNIPSTAQKFGDSYYQVYFDASIGWHDAKTACENSGGHLATISNKEENDFIFSLVQNAGIQCWLGATDEETEGVWKWVTDEPWIFNNGSFDNRSGIQHYLVMNYDNNYVWDDQSEKANSIGGFFCKTGGYVCEWETLVDIPDDAVRNNGNYYKIFDNSLSWSEAKTFCEEMGGHLVTITSQEEQNFLIHLSNVSGKKNLWIGACAINGTYSWITGEDFSQYSNWDSGEPNNVYNSQFTAMMYTSKSSKTPGNWNDENENGRSWTGYYLSDFGFICEWDSLISVPESPDEPEGDYPVTDTVQFTDDIVFLDIGEKYQLTAILDGENITDKSRFSITGDTVAAISLNGEVTAIAEGYTTAWVNDYESNTYDTCGIYVGKPNEIKYSSISDTEYYYGEGGFFSDACQFSDSADIYLNLQNKLNEEIEYTLKNEEFADELEALNTGKVTLTATVSGNDLSFEKEKYANTYTKTYDEISIGKFVDDLLTLFPYNLSLNASDKKSYTVTVKLESDDFDTITQNYKFNVSDLAYKNINQHIDFVNTNASYKALKTEDFASNMAPLKKDRQYIWAKYSTFDFNNYYEVLFADVLVQMLGVYQIGQVSLLPVVKEWVGNYNTVLDAVSTMIEDGYTGYLDINENIFDKLFKKSKYTTELCEDDELYQTVLSLLNSDKSKEKIKSIFSTIDKSKQAYSFLKIETNICSDVIDCINCLSVTNVYKRTTDSFKTVIEKLYEKIPDSEKQAKQAVKWYIDADSLGGISGAVVESIVELSGHISETAITKVFNKQIISAIGTKIGKIAVKSGKTLSETTVYSAITTGLGAVATGVSLGLCISDILCDNSGQAKEMSKVVAASAYAPYIIETLNYFENNLKAQKTDESLKQFEYAFNLHKAVQVYSLEHTYNALKKQGNAMIVKLFSTKDFAGAMTDVAALKTTLSGLNCCDNNGKSTVDFRTKTIAIKCPVDVYLYDAIGKEVVRIINDVTEYAEYGITVLIVGSKKYITVPANQEYSIKIVATDNGKMSYSITEYGKSAKRTRVVNNNDIILTKGAVFTGKIADEFANSTETYALSINETLINPNETILIPVSGLELSEVLLTLETGDTAKLTANIRPLDATNTNVIWQTNNGHVVRVDENGVITAVESGAATITVTTVDGEFIASCEVIVNAKTIPEISIRVPSNTTINCGDTLVLHADFGETELPEGYAILWTVDGSGISTAVSADGTECRVTSIATGNVTVKATLVDDTGEAIFDADGNEISAAQQLTSKAGFWQKFISFFKNLFRISRIILQYK